MDTRCRKVTECRGENVFCVCVFVCFLLRESKPGSSDFVSFILFAKHWLSREILKANFAAQNSTILQHKIVQFKK